MRSRITIRLCPRSACYPKNGRYYFCMEIFMRMFVDRFVSRDIFFWLRRRHAGAGGYTRTPEGRRGPGDGGGPSSGRFLTYSNTPLPICRFLPLPMMAADVSISISFLVSLVEGNPFYIFPSCEDSENGNESGKKKSFSFF